MRKLWKILIVIFVAIGGIALYFAYKLYGWLTSMTEVGTALICPSTMDTIGALCFDKCPDGYTNDGTGICYGNTPANWEGTNSLMYLEKASSPSTLGSAIGCSVGKTMRGALCYDNCPAGYSSDGTNGCYQDCPTTWDGTSSLMYCEKKREYSPAISPDSCPEGYEFWGGTCYKKCPVNGTRTASCTCDFGAYGGVYTNCADTRITSAPYGGVVDGYPGYRKTATCTVQKGGIITDCANFGTTVAPSCRTGYTKKGLLCYANCPSGKQRLDSDLEYCSSTCPAGFTDIGMSCQKPSTSVTSAVPDTCPAGQEKHLASCYTACPNGREIQDSNVAFCTTKCPAGFTDIGVSCARPSQRTASHTLPEVGVCPSGKVKKDLLCYSQ
jgi:hypothetical protein